MNRIKVINEGFVPFVTKEEDEIMIRNTYHENGRREGIKESALNMLKENIDIKVISKVTGLDEEEIKALKD